jgi:uncharacterized membrane protein YdjX (TVP38/TMEM64 family)
MMRRLLIFVVFVGALVVLYLLAREHLTWALFIEKEAGLRTWIEQNPWTGFAVCFTVYLGVSLIPGTTGKAIIAGWLFGFWRGIVLVNVGLTAAALLSFAISRYGLHDLVASRCGPRLARANDALEREGAGYLFVARVLHVPFCITNYVMGATRIRLGGFWWATQLGILPGNILYVYAGSQAPSLQELEEHGLLSLVSPGLIIAFVAISILPLLLRPLARRLTTRVRDRCSPGASAVVDRSVARDRDVGSNSTRRSV